MRLKFAEPANLTTLCAPWLHAELVRIDLNFKSVSRFRDPNGIHDRVLHWALAAQLGASTPITIPDGAASEWNTLWVAF
jgi:hypothetical protein